MPRQYDEREDNRRFLYGAILITTITMVAYALIRVNPRVANFLQVSGSMSDALEDSVLKSNLETQDNILTVVAPLVLAIFFLFSVNRSTMRVIWMCITFRKHRCYMSHRRGGLLTEYSAVCSRIASLVVELWAHTIVVQTMLIYAAVMTIFHLLRIYFFSLMLGTRHYNYDMYWSANISRKV